MPWAGDVVSGPLERGERPLFVPRQAEEPAANLGWDFPSESDPDFKYLSSPARDHDEIPEDLLAMFPSERDLAAKAAAERAPSENPRSEFPAAATPLPREPVEDLPSREIVGADAPARRAVPARRLMPRLAWPAVGLAAVAGLVVGGIRLSGEWRKHSAGDTVPAKESQSSVASLRVDAPASYVSAATPAPTPSSPAPIADPPRVIVNQTPAPAPKPELKPPSANSAAATAMRSQPAPPTLGAPSPAISGAPPLIQSTAGASPLMLPEPPAPAPVAISSADKTAPPVVRDSSAGAAPTRDPSPPVRDPSTSRGDPVPPRRDPSPPTPPPPARDPSPNPSPPSRDPSPDDAVVPIQRVIDRYRAAFNALDADSVQSFWPSVNTKALSRAFDQLDIQTFEFDSCTIDAGIARATASCAGKATYEPRIGSRTPRTDPRRWTFHLQKLGGNWVIESVESK